MELRLLRYFVAVADEGHITRAAEKLGMQQPPLSQQIKILERELGVQLFRRLPRGVMLTEAGKTFLRDAREILARLDHAAETAQRAARGEQGELSIGIASTAHFCPLVPRLIRAFRDAFPQVAIKLSEGGTGELVARVLEGLVDLAFVRKILVPAEDLAIVHLLDEPMVAALPSNHRLMRGKAIPMKQLAGEVFISYRRPEGPGLTDVIDAACRSAGFTPRFGQEAPRPASALNFVAAGHGIAIVPSSLQRMRLDGVCYRPLKNSVQLKAPLNLISRRRETSPALRNFLKITARRA